MNKQISIIYNGRRAHVTCMTGNKYYVQIISTPYVIESQQSDEGNRKWVETDGQRETKLSQTIGRLIEQENYCAS